MFNKFFKKRAQSINLFEKRFEKVFESAYDAIWLLEGEFIVDCNNKCLELFDVERKDIIGKSVLDFTPQFQPNGEESRPLSQIYINQMYKQGSTKFEWTHIKHNGKAFLTDISLSFFKLSTKSYITAFIRDITELRKEQDELYEYRLNLEEIVKEKTNQLAEKVKQLHFAYEELDTANEELISTNEELYATNEELDQINKNLTQEIENHYKTSTDKALAEEKLKQFIFQSSNGIIIVNSSGAIEEWNESMFKLSGVQSNEAKKSLIWDVISEMVIMVGTKEEIQNRFKKNILAFFEKVETGDLKPIIFEAQIRHRNLSLKYFQITLFPIISAIETFTGCVLNDITQKKKTEAELENYREELEKLIAHQSEHLLQLSERFNEVYTNSSDAITFIDILEDGKALKVFDMNPTARKLFEISEDMISKGVYAKDLIDKTKIESFEKKILPVVFSGQMVSFTEERDTGNGLWNSTIYPIKNENGQVNRIASFSKNVTAEYEKEKMQAILNSAINSWPSEFWITDIEGRCIIQNQVSIKIWGNLSGQSIDVLDIPQETKQLTKEKIALGLNGNPSSTELVIDTHKGKRYIMININPIIQNDKITGILGMGIDITELKISENALKNNEKQLQLLLSTITDYTYTISIVDGKKVRTYHSEGCLPVTGYNPEEFQNNPFLWFEMVYEKDRDLVSEWSQQIAKGFDVPTIEHRIRHKNGQIRWVTNTTVFRRDIDGSIIGYDGMVTNITERKVAEEKIKASEEKYRMLAENIDDVIFKYDLNSGKFTFVSPSVLKLRGFTVEEAMEQSMKEVIVPENVQNHEKAIAERVQRFQEGDLNYQFQKEEIQILHKNGGTFWVEMVSTILTDQHGNASELLAVSRDITVRKEAEEKIKQLALLNQTILDTVSIGLLFVKDRKVQWANESFCASTGYNFSEIHNKETSLFYDNLKDFEMVGNIGYPVLTKAEIFTHEIKIKKKDNSSFWCNLGGKAVNPDNFSDGSIWYFQDISERKRVEKELISSEEKFRKAFISSPIISSISALSDGKYIDINDSFTKMLGWKREEVIGKTPKELGVFYDYSKRIELADFMEKNGQLRNYELMLKTKSGEKRITEFSAELVDIKGEPCLLTLINDITERKKDEEKIKASEEKYRLLAENIDDVIFRYDINSRKYTYISPSVLKLRGFTAEEVMQQNMDEVIVPRCMQKIQKSIAERVQKLQEGDLNYRSQKDEMQIYHKNGESIWVEMSSTLLTDQNGNVSEILAVSRDISERKQAEEKFKKLADLNQTILDTVNIGIFFLKHTKIEWVNRSMMQLFGFDLEDLIGKNPSIITQTKDEFYKLREIALQKISKDGIFRTELLLRKKSGKLFWVNLEGKAINHEAPMEGSIWIIQDINERKIADNLLKQLSNLHHTILDTVTAGIAFVKDRKTQWANKAYFALTGYHSSEIMEKPTSVVYKYSDEYDRVGIEGYTVIAKGEVYSTEILMKRKDGSLFYCHLTGKAIDTSDISKGSIWALHDITKRKKAEDELKKSESILKATLQSMSDGILVVLADGKISHANVRFSQIFSIQDNLIETKNDLILLDYAKQQLVNPDEFFSNVLEIYKSNDITEDILHLVDGRIVERHSFPLIENSPLKGRVWTFRDVTEKKKSAEALTKSQKLLTESQRIAHIGCWEVDFLENKVTWNEEIFELFGFKYMEIQPTMEILQELVHPDDRAKFISIDEEMMKTNVFKDYECRIISKDGTILTILIVGAFAFDETGRPCRIYGIVQDITEKIRTRDLIIESEKKFRSIFNSSKDGIVLLDKDLNIIDINKAVLKKTEYLQDEIINKKAIDFISLEQKEETLKWFSDLKNNKFIENFEANLMTSKHDQLPVEISAASLVIDENEIILLLLRDISERKRLEKELLNVVIKTEEIERLNFSQELHDGLGPLLSAAKMYVEWLEKPNANIKTQDVIPDIKNLLVEAGSTVREISFKLSPHILQNYGLIEALKAYTEKIKESGKIAFEISVENYKSLGETTDTIIYRVLCECINNTIKHAKAHLIKIKFITDESKITINYSDDGVGFNLEKAFKVKKGVGILNIQNRLKSINGSFTIQSSEGKGTNIIIIIRY